VDGTISPLATAASISPLRYDVFSMIPAPGEFDRPFRAGHRLAQFLAAIGAVGENRLEEGK
jgi:hypothetical protein